jgi:hypothetical protein
MDQDHEGNPPSPSWAPQGSAAAPEVVIERAGPDGPPPPPHVRQRRRRTRLVLLVLAALLLIAVPVGFALGGVFAQQASPGAADGTVDEPASPDPSDPDVGEPDDAPDASEPEGREGEPDSPDPGAPDPPTASDLVPPDLDELVGTDAEFGRLLIDIDASERTMIGFQDDLGAALRSPPSGPDALRERIREVAADRQRELREVRERLEAELDDPGADGVRDRYVVHLDSWADYMAAIEADPSILAAETDGGFTVAINATADAFSRALEQELERGLDGSIERFAEAILERGFRGFGQAEV